jgi:hypothetical protein
LDRSKGFFVLFSDSSDEISPQFSSHIDLTVTTQFGLKSEQSKQIWEFFLRQIDPSGILDVGAIYAAIEDIVSEYFLSGAQIRQVMRGALATSESEQRKLTDQDLYKSIAAITSQTYELDLVTDGAFYKPVDCPESLRNDPDIKEFPEASWSLPTDDRLDLSFTMDSLIRLKPDSDSIPHPLRRVKTFYQDLLRWGGDCYILDWGWPSGQWRTLPGLQYRIGSRSKPGAVLWNSKRLTYGPRKYMDAKFGHGKPWRRLV